MAACLKNPIRAKKKNPNLFSFLLVFSFITISCISSQKKEMASSSETIVLFYLKKGPETPLFLEPDTWLPIASSVLTGAPIDSTDKTEFVTRWQKLFKFAGIPEPGVISRDPIRVLTEEETAQLGELLFKAEADISDGLPHAYQVIIKREDPIRPGLRIRRTVFYIRNRADGLILEFSEIGQVLDFQTPYSFREWTLVPVSKPDPSTRNSIYLPEIRPEGLDFLSPLPGQAEETNRICVKTGFWTSQILKDTASEPKKFPKSVEDRLKTLKELLDKKLISKPEYEKKKAEILKDL
ncbi:SHOCT domain-containing protein [Leptospira langatensis]|uniref:SHOCT domain-containing protein n=1 Tax=Leptospira langatensis TaxID=2484983 RepID=A0A5F1ZTQ2_9LEPT|nr:SHOCT domain-containing protein [Leptospira langatensis]TGK03064.1 SHOCT domain-containing protein [Leptospira langatensis]TGL41820.1 SHOCT domain-containing protein [Leptospira langatensis]